MRKKDGDAEGFGEVTGPRTLTPLDIQQKEFGVSRLGGYKMRDVDEFLDELTEAMTQLTEENERLHAQSLLPAAPTGSPGIADASREAEEILARAREEAAEIVRTARSQGGGGAGGDPADDRASIGAFLSREREFLQSLAALVQGHAEGVKELARTARQTRPAAPAPESETIAPVESAPPEGGPASDEPAAASQPEVQDAIPQTPSVSASPAGEEAIRVDEPQPAVVSGPENDDAPAEGGGDRSLRELFWGED
jgi:DivIVA domain-containing protein